jgi:hypothetical protein
MKTPDLDGLSRSQIERINRLQMTRYRRLNKGARHSENKMAVFIISLFCLWIVACMAISGLIKKEMAANIQLFTSLPSNLDDQSPSITIYAKDLGKP